MKRVQDNRLVCACGCEVFLQGNHLLRKPPQFLLSLLFSPLLACAVALDLVFPQIAVCAKCHSLHSYDQSTGEWSVEKPEAQQS